MELLPRFGETLAPPKLLQSLAAQPDAPFHVLNEQEVRKVSLRLCQPAFTEPFQFGFQAAAHGLSVQLGAGAKPLAALALLGGAGNDVSGRYLVGLEAGMSACCQDAGVKLVGIHVFEDANLSAGLLVIGQLNPRNTQHLSPLRVGDKLILGKALGDGLYRQACIRGELSLHEQREWVEEALRPNMPGPTLDCLDGVRQVCEVGAGGLAACLAQMIQGQQGIRVNLNRDALPTLPQVSRMVANMGDEAALSLLLKDEPLNGPLLVACNGETVTEVLSIFLQQGFGQAVQIGEVVAEESGA